MVRSISDIWTLIDNWDYTALLWIQDVIRNDVLTPVMKVITTLGNKGLIWILLVVVLLIPKKTRKAALMAGITMAICHLLNDFVIKPGVARIRPYEAHEDIKRLVAMENSFSFSSGHTMSAFAGTLIYLRMIPKKISIPAVLFAIVISFSRLYVGVHYPTDVIAGFLIALIISQILWSVWMSAERNARRRKKKKQAEQVSAVPASNAQNFTAPATAGQAELLQKPGILGSGLDNQPIIQAEKSRPVQQHEKS